MKNNLSVDEFLENKSREEIIAAILAAQDVEEFSEITDTNDIKSFRSALKSSMENAAEQTRKRSDQNKKKNLRNIILIAAAAAVSLLILWPVASPTELSVRYFKQHNILLENSLFIPSRSQNDGIVILFREEAYEALKELTEQSEVSIEKDADLLLLYAISCFETGDSISSLNLLKSLAHEGQHTIVYQAKWYAALTMIRLGNQNEALAYIQEISNTKGPYQQKARKLNRRIKSNR